MTFVGRAKVATSFGLAIIAASNVIAPSHAADLGGECCADLDERIAELEATTARKGNRRVSLTVSGYVAQKITAWDDGGEQNIYLNGLGPTQASNFRFSGQAQIAPGWTAGYLMRIQNLTDNPFGRDATGAMDQNSDEFSQGLNVQMSYWYLQSKELGKLSVGRQAFGAKSIAMFTDQSGTQLFDNYTFLSGFPQFIVRSDGDLAPAGLTWGQLAFCYSQALPLGGDCAGIVQEGLRYDTPTFAGFSASASWGEDDVWEVGGRYAGEFGGFKIALGVGYSVATDENSTGASVSPKKESEFAQAGGFIQHLETGLFLHGAYGYEDNNDTLLSNGRVAEDGEHWYVKAGVRRKWTPLGATVIYGDYAEYLDQIGPGALALGVESSTFRRYGGGIVQEIDAAAMTVYVKYEHYDASVAGDDLAAAVTGLDDADFVSSGAVINF